MFLASESIVQDKIQSILRRFVNSRYDNHIFGLKNAIMYFILNSRSYYSYPFSFFLIV
jgi:hypothetical protein